MLAKSPEARQYKGLRASILGRKMGIWGKFGGWDGFSREMLAKLARRGYAVRVSAIGVLLPLMP